MGLSGDFRITLFVCHHCHFFRHCEEEPGMTDFLRVVILTKQSFPFVKTDYLQLAPLRSIKTKTE
jgi:hypothetical protein